MRHQKWVSAVFCLLVALTLLTPFLIFQTLLFPYVTSKAFYLRIILELALPFYFYLVLVNKDYRPNFKNPLTIFVLAFLGLSVVSSITGVNPLRSLWGNFERMGGSFYLAHLVLLYFYVLLFGQISRVYIKRLIIAVISLGGVVAFQGFMVSLTRNHFLYIDPSFPRVSTTFGNPIFLASFLIIPMFLTLYYLIGEPKIWLRTLYAFIVVMEVYCILLSQTRGAVVSIVVGLFVCAAMFVFLTPRKNLRRWGSAAVLVFALVMALLFSFHNKFPQGSTLRRVFNLQDANTESRLIQWQVALKGFVDRPLLGTGPENYYIVANSHYNPAIFKYDASWFDKPHNYLLEVLVTGGVFGFIAYVGMVIFAFVILFKAYQKDLLNLAEFCILSAGLLVYELQNLFVFDTIPASMMFFTLFGFFAFLWQEYKKESSPGKKKFTPGLSTSIANPLVGTLSVVLLYLLYAANASGMSLSKDINLGYAYTSAQADTARDYFQTAVAAPFNFDPVQLAEKYSSFATNLAANPRNQTNDKINQDLDNVQKVLQDTLSRVPNDPTSWQELSNVYLTKSIFNKTLLPLAAVDAAKTAMQLAPKRPEPEFMLARLQIFQNDLDGAAKTLQQLIADIPEDKEAVYQLALIYSYKNQSDKALSLAEQALAGGYKPEKLEQIDWLAQIYVQKKDWLKAVGIFEQELTMANGNNLNTYFNLAQAYVKSGQKDRGIAMAQAVANTDASWKKRVDDFIKSVQ